MSALWIGGTDQANEGTWIWSATGEVMSYTNAWRPSEPQNRSGEDCIILSKGHGYTWIDHYCTSYNSPFICETIQT